MKRRLKSRKGATLVELLVTFGLLTIFIAAAVAVIGPATEIFLKVKYLSYAQNISDMVMEKVSGEIASASEDVHVDGGLISFRDSKSSPLFIHAEDGLLKIRYRMIKEQVNGEYTGTVLWPAADWAYDQKAYQGFAITQLRFERVSDNSVKIVLALLNTPRDVTYSSEKVVECYNLKPENPVKEETVYTSDDEFYEHERP